MANERAERISIENARIIWRNFAGRATMFKPEGTRMFSVVLDEETAQEFTARGLNVKLKEPKEEGDDAFYYLEVAVSFAVRPPRVVMIANGVQTTLDESTVEILDSVEILNVDLTINPYEWTVGANSGIKAYLKSIFVTIDLDPIEAKYLPKGGAGD